MSRRSSSVDHVSLDRSRHAYPRHNSSSNVTRSRPPPSLRKKDKDSLNRLYHEVQHPENAPPVFGRHLEQVVKRTRPPPVKKGSVKRSAQAPDEKAFRNIQKDAQIAELQSQPLPDDYVGQSLDDDEHLDAQSVVREASGVLIQLKRIKPDNTIKGYYIDVLSRIKDKVYEESYTVTPAEKQEVEDAKTYVLDMKKTAAIPVYSPGTGFMKKKRNTKRRKRP